MLDSTIFIYFTGGLNKNYTDSGSEFINIVYGALSPNLRRLMDQFLSGVFSSIALWYAAVVLPIHPLLLLHNSVCMCRARVPTQRVLLSKWTVVGEGKIFASYKQRKEVRLNWCYNLANRFSRWKHYTIYCSPFLLFMYPGWNCM